eukprot:TRINITY_DN8350_c0_g1_i3.p1 TRINITY_DN8350_c0_g1~~TRINITY_DN8350_c0_g1_i3.p1  ORF type:complete len:125 (+),score=20.59 TRINITY_DN8350_c0_g1_i3:123-497(+)
MIRRPPRSTLSSSSAASDVYKRQVRQDMNAEVTVRTSFSSSVIRSCIAVTVSLWDLRADTVVSLASANSDSRRLSSSSSTRGRLTPVSYTHLRAHETPEHLVCRLLLEKKKKKQYKLNTVNHKY